ncbi:DUF6708 domain-containing protein [Pseudomonas sp. MBLB4123]|uniref:DUF6708 domain-containing protein n=1 Tax=Pseudomonas sp. MBLB4123 TaxID=3451557 RepID=UPI003F753DFB
MPESQYERLPQAGDIDRQTGLEILYLAPRPLPTGQAPLSAQQMHREVNDSYLDFAQGGGRIEFGVRVILGTFTLLVLFWLFTTGLMAWSDWKYWGKPFFLTWSSFFFGSWAGVILFGIFFAIYGGVFVYAVHQEVQHPPIRFNRQRREVCYIPAKGKPAYIPWEELIACASVEQTITQFAVNTHFALRLGFRDTLAGQMYWLNVPSASLMFAVSEWEALRVYMEQGPSALPAPPPPEYEEGSLAYFRVACEVYREQFGFIRYRGWWLLQVLTGWTLPCHVGEWFSRLPKAGFPKEVREWSKSLPPEQWAKPSTELLAQSADIQAAYARGQDFMQYFNATFSDAATNPDDVPQPPRKRRGKGKRAAKRGALN